MVQCTTLKPIYLVRRSLEIYLAGLSLYVFKLLVFVYEYIYPFNYRKIRLIECNAKCRYQKLFTCKEIKRLCGRCFICLMPPPLL
jgi:hypothetical protein